jgi:hypothetical protein
MEIVHRAWMLEEADRYCLAAETLALKKNLDRQAQVNAALSIEILLKSFLAETDLYKGEVHETYNSVFGHDLVVLADKAPSDIRSILGLMASTAGVPLTRSRRYIEQYRKTFFEDRYIYESLKDKEGDVKQRPAYSSEFISVARSLIDKTINIYIDTGSNDPWVNSKKCV